MTITEQLQAIVDEAYRALGEVAVVDCDDERLLRMARCVLLEARALLVESDGEHPEEEP